MKKKCTKGQYIAPQVDVTESLCDCIICQSTSVSGSQEDFVDGTWNW